MEVKIDAVTCDKLSEIAAQIVESVILNICSLSISMCACERERSKALIFIDLAELCEKRWEVLQNSLWGVLFHDKISDLIFLLLCC